MRLYVEFLFKHFMEMICNDPLILLHSNVYMFSISIHGHIVEREADPLSAHILLLQYICLKCM